MKLSIKLFTFLAVGFLLINFGFLSGEVSAGDNIQFRDDFMGKSLRPEWDISAKDPRRMTLIDNEYLLLVTYGPGAKNRMVYKGELPENYEITLKIETTPESKGQVAHLRLWEDPKNNLSVGYWINWTDYKKIYFWKYLSGEVSKYSKSIQISKGAALFLKLSKKGIEYTGYYSLDGASWSKVGTHVFLNLKGKPEFGVYNERRKDIPESGIRIDYFEIKIID